ncbi:thiol reductant ABC exporter subunit CydD [Actinoplanes sp. G11-F43]|uniref:thiol reductant ABC exporter subunit CydD n=1 Tax=Actinoplanes sp. G11-F43 TaxID=3424130 RepID=UPI003D338EBB
MKPLDPRLLRYARATRTYLVATVALGAVHAVLLIAQALLLAEAITAVFLDGAGVTALTTGILGTRTPLLAALVLVIAAKAAVAWLQEVAAARSAATVKSQLRRHLLDHVAALGPAGRKPAGEIATLAGDGLDALDSYFARYLPQLVLAALVPGILLLKLLPADLLATGTIALTLPLIPLFMALVGMHTEAQNRRQFRLLARLSHHFLDVIAGLPTLKLFGRARAQAGIIRRISDDQRRHTMRTLRTAFLSSLVLELLATLSVALVAVGIGLRLVSGSLDLTTALLVLILAPEAYRPLREVGANFHASAEGLAAAEEVFAVLETPLPATGTRTPPTGDIVFDQVEVRFPDRSGTALRLTATIEPGSVVALTGPSGCGKSTALSVLLGLVTPTAGQVTVGGVPLKDLDLAAWRRRIAWVPQRPHLFASTVHDNIALPDAPFPEVVAAARDAGADTFIRDLPESYTTPLGDHGTGLSAGQRQRIALARAFLRDAPIVLLDEPTANLDTDTAAEVMTAIRRLAAGRTVLIAAHRPELIALADRVIPLTENLVPA